MSEVREHTSMRRYLRYGWKRIRFAGSLVQTVGCLGFVGFIQYQAARPYLIYTAWVTVGQLADTGPAFTRDDFNACILTGVIVAQSVWAFSVIAKLFVADLRSGIKDLAS